MKKRSFGHYFTHALFDFFESAHSMHGVVSTFAALTVVVFFFPYVGLAFFALSILAAVGMATYSAIQLKQKDDKYFRLAKENATADKNQQELRKKQLDVLNSLVLVYSLEAENAQQQRIVYQQFSGLLQLLDEYLETSTAHEQLAAITALKQELGDDWAFIKDSADSIANASTDIDRLIRVNQRLEALLQQRLKADVASVTSNAQMSPVASHLALGANQTATAVMQHKTTTATALMPPLSDKEDMAARKRALWTGLKMAFSVAVLSIAAIAVVAAIAFPPVTLAAIVLPLIAVGVTVTAISLSVGTLAAYHDFHVVQPKLREQAYIQKQHQEKQSLRAALTIQHKKAASQTLLQQHGPDNQFHFSQHSSQSFENIEHRTQFITKSLKETPYISDKTENETTSSDSVKNNPNFPIKSFELAAKPMALTTTSKEELTIVKHHAPQTATNNKVTQKRWWHYLAAGTFEFINRASNYYMVTSLTAAIAAAVVTTLLAPYITLAALVLTFVGSAAAVGYYTWQQVQKDRALERLQQENREIEVRRERWREQIRRQQHLHEKTNKLTGKQDLQTKELTEFTLLVHALEDFLLTLTHDERFHALVELNEILGEDWQFMQNDLPNKLVNDASYTIITKLNSEIKDYLSSHISEEVRARYLSRHPKLSSLVTQASQSENKVKEAQGANHVMSEPTKANMMPNATIVSTVAALRPTPSRRRALWNGCKTTVSTLALLVAAASITVSIIFPPAVIPAIVLPLVGIGVGLLAVSVATGLAAAYYDYKVLQPRQQEVKDIETKHQQYLGIAKKLDELDQKRAKDEKLSERKAIELTQKQSDIRLEGMKARAMSAVERLSQGFKTMRMELSSRYSSKVTLPEFESLMKPVPMHTGILQQNDEFKPMPSIMSAPAA